MADFLWKKLSESDIKKIEVDAKKLILEFGDTLENLKVKEEIEVERDSDSREEGSGEKCDDDFRKRVMDNAPKTKDDCVVAEKGTWVESSSIHSSKSQTKGGWVE